MTDTSTHTGTDRIAELEAKVAELTARLDATTAPAEVVDRDAVESRGSRRNILKLAAGAAVGGTAALATSSGRAAAADTDPVEIGASTTQGDTGPTSTRISYTNGSVPQVPSVLLGATADANVFTAHDQTGSFLFNPAGSSFPAAVAGYGYSTLPNGVYGFTSSDTPGFGVVGVGTGPNTGVLARGDRANIELRAGGAAPAARSDAHSRGELINDADGNLWLCVDGGSPGRWTKLAGPASAGTFHAVEPFRASDSRQPSGGGRFEGGSNRTVSIKDARDVGTGEVSVADVVPAGATAIAANITAIAATTNGFLSVNPGGDAVIKASSVNYTAGQNTSNAGIFPLNGDREVQVIFGPGGGGHLAIDVSGYWL